MGSEKQISECSGKQSSTKEVKAVSPNPTASFNETETLDSRVTKIIYHASDDINNDRDEEQHVLAATTTTVALPQGAMTAYLILAVLYQWTWAKLDDGTLDMLIIIGILEMAACLVLIRAMKRPYTGNMCSFLSFHFILFFLIFSAFLHSTSYPDSSFIEKALGLTTVSLIVSMVHLFIFILAIKMIGASEKPRDYSDRVIVDNLEKRRIDSIHIISNLMAEINLGDNDTNLSFAIRNKATGRPKTLGGTNVETGVSRLNEMRLSHGRVTLSRSSTSLASVRVPKEDEDIESKRSESSWNERKYNNCVKQKEYLNPRLILESD